MNNIINNIYNKIEVLSPIHAKKLKKNIAYFDDLYYERLNTFMHKYNKLLKSNGKTIDYAINCYLKMIADITTETIDFFHTGKYTSSMFDEVNKRVYANPETMEYYMHGLLLSQFLWKHHYQIYDYYSNTLPKYAGKVTNYLEIGAGHGLYLSKALEIFDNKTIFSVIDISQTSIDLTKYFIEDSRINFNLSNIFDYKKENCFDFISMGEVLEHVEDPLKLLLKLNCLLTADGTVFITTPTNAPTIDHIYLFRNVKEIQELIKQAGFEISSEKYFLSEDVPLEIVEKNKISIMYGAFLKK
jgi:SAM-dependent methyltransferase